MSKSLRDNLIVCGILAVLLGAAVIGVYMPQSRKLRDLQAQAITQKLEIEASSEQTAAVPALISRIQTMKQRYKDFDRRLPRSKDLGGFLKEISGNLASSVLTNGRMDTGNPTRQDLFHTMPITMRFSGSYLALTGFLDRINQMERLTRVQKLLVKMPASRSDQSNGDAESLEIELQMNIYFTES